MNDWIPISPTAFSWKRKNLHGVNVDMGLSPYDIPEAVRGSEDPASGWFKVEFRYPTTAVEEMNEAELRKDLLKAAYGKKSGRLYAIRINTKEIVRQHIGQSLDHIATTALDSLRPANLPHSRRGEHLSDLYSLNKSIIKERKSEIFQSVH